MARWFYGRRAVVEILKSGQPVRRVLVSEGCGRGQISEFMDLARSRNVSCEVVSKKVLASLVRGNHQGVAAETERAEPIDFKSFIGALKTGPGTFVCLLDEVQDPQNLGAIIRSAVCFGCAGVVLPKWHSAGLTPAVMKASSGAAAHCRVAMISNLGVAIERLKEQGFYVVGADAGPETESIRTIRFTFPLAIVLGGEHGGIKPILKRSCDRLVSIPQIKTVASLNVSNAAAILFYKASEEISRSGG